MADSKDATALESLRSKGSDRIQINNILSAVCVGVLSILLGLSNSAPNGWIAGQLALAVPLLVTSSLAYAKTCYRDVGEYRTWDWVGWATHSMGYILVLNAMAIILYSSGLRSLAWLFICTVIGLFAVYSAIDVALKPRRLVEKALKLFSYVLLLSLGSVVPMLAGWA